MAKRNIFKKVKVDCGKNEMSLIAGDYNLFEISLARYNQQVIDLCRTICGREYNPETKKWSLPISSYDEFVKELINIPEILLVRGISETERKKVQAIVVADYEHCCFIQIPYDDDLNTLFKNYSGVYSTLRRNWQINSEKKEDLFKRLSGLKIEIKKLCDKPKRMYFSNTFILF